MSKRQEFTNWINQIEIEVSEKIDRQILEFDQENIFKLKISILSAKDQTNNFELFLKDMLKRAERLECYTVCVVVRDLLKDLKND